MNAAEHDFLALFMLGRGSQTFSSESYITTAVLNGLGRDKPINLIMLSTEQTDTVLVLPKLKKAQKCTSYFSRIHNKYY